MLFFTCPTTWCPLQITFSLMFVISLSCFLLSFRNTNFAFAQLAHFVPLCIPSPETKRQDKKGDLRTYITIKFGSSRCTIKTLLEDKVAITTNYSYMQVLPSSCLVVNQQNLDIFNACFFMFLMYYILLMFS